MPHTDGSGLLLPWLALAVQVLSPVVQPHVTSSPNHSVRLKFKGLFSHAQGSPGNTLGELATKLGFTADEVMALGDQGNDLTMIQYAGLGVAMGNAIDEVKDAAQAVTLTNAEDGVAAAIRKYALK